MFYHTKRFERGHELNIKYAKKKMYMQQYFGITLIALIQKINKDFIKITLWKLYVAKTNVIRSINNTVLIFVR